MVSIRWAASTFFFLLVLACFLLSSSFRLTQGLSSQRVPAEPSHTAALDISPTSAPTQAEPVIVMSQEQLKNVCKTLPEVNEFGDLSAERIDSNGVIYFHFLLMYRNLKPVYFCAIEGLLQSIQKSNSSTQKIEVILWFSEAEARKSSLLSDFLPKLYSPDETGRLSVSIKALNLTDVFKGTPFQGFYNCYKFHGLPLGEFAQQNKGNAARLALLYKYGGFYLDLDFIVGKDLSVLEDGLAMQDEWSFNNAALKFTSEGSRLFIESLMKEWVVNYKDIWGNNGPVLIRRVMVTKKQCTFPSGLKGFFHGFTAFCKYGVKDETEKLAVWPTTEVYPIPYLNSNDLLKEAASTRAKYSNITGVQNPVLVHLWHHFVESKETTSCKGNWTKYSNSYLGNLRKLTCPVVFSTLSGENGCTF